MNGRMGGDGVPQGAPGFVRMLLVGVMHGERATLHGPQTRDKGVSGVSGAANELVFQLRLSGVCN